jgi:hypothetical protein
MLRMQKATASIRSKGSLFFPVKKSQPSINQHLCSQPFSQSHCVPINLHRHWPTTPLGLDSECLEHRCFNKYQASTKYFTAAGTARTCQKDCRYGATVESSAKRNEAGVLRGCLRIISLSREVTRRKGSIPATKTSCTALAWGAC